MPIDKRLSKTMRIDIPPDVRAGWRPAQQQAEVPTGTPAVHGNSEFQQLFQSVYDGALITELDGRIVDANIRALEFLRYERAEVCRLNVLQVISGADAGTLKTLRESLDTDRFILIQAHCARRDASLFPAEIAVNRLQSGATRYLCFFVRDITLRRKAEEMLQTVHTAIQNAGTGIAIADSQGRLDYVNPAAAALWGFEQAETLRGQNVRGLLQEPERVETLIQAVLAGGRWTGEIKARRQDGTEFLVQVAAAANRDAEDQVAGMVLSFLDTSDRKRAEDAERQAERQRVMVESLGAACHHLGQPSTILLASLELMRKLHGKTTSG